MQNRFREDKSGLIQKARGKVVSKSIGQNLIEHVDRLLALREASIHPETTESLGLNRKPKIKVTMASNPNPDPHIDFVPTCHRAMVSRHPNRPETRILAQAFQLQTRMSGVLAEFLVGPPRALLDVRWQPGIKLPEDRYASRRHEWRSKSLSLISGKAFGFRRYSASTASTKAERAGLGVGSLRILSQARSPSNSGIRSGKSSTNLARSPEDSVRIANSISLSELMQLNLVGPRRRVKRILNSTYHHNSQARQLGLLDSTGQAWRLHLLHLLNAIQQFLIGRSSRRVYTAAKTNS